MKTLEKRQARSWLGALFADPYRKLAAVVLAIGLWLMLNLQVEDEKVLVMRLAVVDPQRKTSPLAHQISVELPTDQVVGRRFFRADTVIDTATVVLRGSRGKIDTIDAFPIDLQVKGLLTGDRGDTASTTTVGFVEFTVADIEQTEALRDITIELQPSRIRLEVENIQSQPIDLSAAVVELHVDDPDGFGKRLRLDTATYSPQRVHVLGLASSIEKFNLRAPGTKPLLARLKSAVNERQITTILELNAAPELGLRLKETTPSMTIQVLPFTEMFELEVQLDVDDLALPVELQGRYLIDPETRTKVVRIRAGGQLRTHLTFLRENADQNKLRAWALENLRLNVWIPAMQPGAAAPDDIQCEAMLVLQGALRASVDRTECELAQTELFRLRKTP